MTQQQLSFPEEVNFSPTLPNILDQDDMNCILEPYKYQNDKGGLYLGNIQSALNLQELEFHKIRTVFTTSQDLGFKYPKEIVQNYKCLNAIDRQFYDLSVHFEESIEFIQKHIKNTNILVHCQAGCSRSASIVIIYLMHAKNWNLEQALIFVKRKRPIIHPNPQFMKYLYEYDQKLKAQRKNKESELRLKNQQKIQQIYQMQRAEGFSSRTPSQSKHNIKNLFQQKQEQNIINGNLQYQSLTYIPKNKINLNEDKYGKFNNNNRINNNESVNQIPNTAVCQINQEDDEPEITNRQNLRQQSQGIKIHQNDLNIITKSNQQFTLKSNVKQNYNDYDKENEQQSSIQFNNDKILLTPYDNYKYNQNDLNKMNLQGSKSVGSDRLQQLKSGSNIQKSIPENSKTYKNLTSQFQIEYDTDNHYINQQQLLSVQKKTQSCLQQQPYSLNEQTENQNVKNSVKKKISEQIQTNFNTKPSQQYINFNSIDFDSQKKVIEKNKNISTFNLTNNNISISNNQIQNVSQNKEQSQNGKKNQSNTFNSKILENDSKTPRLQLYMDKQQSEFSLNPGKKNFSNQKVNNNNKYSNNQMNQRQASTPQQKPQILYKNTSSSKAVQKPIISINLNNKLSQQNDQSQNQQPQINGNTKNNNSFFNNQNQNNKINDNNNSKQQKPHQVNINLHL